MIPVFLFAHHDLLETLDFLRLNPVGMFEHIVALLIYSLVFALPVTGYFGFRAGGRFWSRRYEKRIKGS